MLLLYVPSTVCDAISAGRASAGAGLLQQLRLHMSQRRACGAQWPQRQLQVSQAVSPSPVPWSTDHALCRRSHFEQRKGRGGGG